MRIYRMRMPSVRVICMVACLLGVLPDSALSAAGRTNSTTALKLFEVDGMTPAPATVAAGIAIELQATVRSGAAPVHPGTVKFCDQIPTKGCSDIHLVGTAQLITKTGDALEGTASIRIIPGMGLKKYWAQFIGTTTYTGSSSSEVDLTVNLGPTVVTIPNHTGSNPNYSLEAIVAGTGSTPSGTVSFVDRNNGFALKDPVSLTRGSVTEMIGEPSTSINTTYPLPYALAVGDFNDDGIQDLAITHVGAGVTNKNMPISIYLGQKDGGFKPASNSPITINTGATTYNIYSIALGDFDNDGHLDIAVSLVLASGSGAGRVFWLRNKGDSSGNFDPEDEIPPPAEGFHQNMGLTTGDFDNDGNLDLAVVGNVSGTNKIYLYKGNGAKTKTFSAATSLDTGTTPWGVAAGDFNGDGRSDLVVAKPNDNKVAVYLSDGAGWNFKAPEDYSTGKLPRWPVVADINQDGRPDLVVGACNEQNANSLTVLNGSTDGKFAAATGSPYDAGKNACFVAVGKFNSDEYPDLAVTPLSGSGNLRVIAGKNGGDFDTANPLSNQSLGAQSIYLPVAIDFNQDGVSDIAVANGWTNQVDLLPVTSRATASANAADVLVVGKDKTNHDVVACFIPDPADTTYADNSCSSPVLLEAMQLTTNFAPLAPNPSDTPPPAYGQTVTLTATLNASPTPPAKITTNGQEVHFSDNGNPVKNGFLSGGQSSVNLENLASGDHSFTATFDGDDNFKATTTTTTPLLYHVGPAPQGMRVTLSSPTGLAKGQPVVLTAKLQQVDGSALTNIKGTVAFCNARGPCMGDNLLGTAQVDPTATPTVTATLRTYLPAGSSDYYKAIFLGTTTYKRNESDVVKIQMPSENPEKYEVVVTTPTVTYQTGTSCTSANPCQLKANIKGKGYHNMTGGVQFVDATNLNYVLNPKSNDPASVTVSTSTSFITLIPSATAGTAPVSVAVGDLDGDGHLDVATADTDTAASVTLYKGDGTGVLAPASTGWNLPGLGTAPAAVSMGDFDNDGKAELVVADKANQVSLYKWNGTTFQQVGAPVALTTGFDLTGGASLAVDDFNHDGNLDLAVASFKNGQVAILSGDGRFIKAPTTTDVYSVGAGPSSITVGDFDGSHKLSLAVANRTDATVTILTGAGNGTFTPGSPIPVNGNASHPVSIVAGDFRGNGIQDFATANDDGSVTIFFGGDGVTFTQKQKDGIGTKLASIAAADFDGDGIEDLAVSDSDSTKKVLMVLLGDGSGDFPKTVTSSAGASSFGSIAIGDFNQDGTMDLVAANIGSTTTKGITEGQFAVESSADISVSGISIVTDDTTTGHDVNAHYLGDEHFQEGTSTQALTLKGEKLDTSVGGSTIPDGGNVAPGLAIIFMANVVPNPTSADTQGHDIDGTVNFQIQGDDIPGCGSVPLTNHLASCPATYNYLNNYGSGEVIATYSGSPYFKPNHVTIQFSAAARAATGAASKSGQGKGGQIPHVK